MTLDGIPAGLPVDIEKLQKFIDRRAPGQGNITTSRKESDKIETLSGIVDGYTCGAPIAAIIRNTNTRSGDYSNLKDCPRPGHADFSAQMKYGGYQDIAGGGHFSGRLTAPLCIAGGLCLQWLEAMRIQIAAHIVAIGGVVDEPVYLDRAKPDLQAIGKDFAVLNPEAGEKMKSAIAAAKADGDSVGGLIECIAVGIPAGIGEPMFGGMESKIAQIIYGIPGVKGLSFGTGFAGSYMKGSENNDQFIVENGQVRTKRNFAGGILGGITNGMPLVFEVAVKPTPSISKPQKSVSLSTMEETELVIQGRHDPCIVPRAVPVVEAAAAIAIYDAILLNAK
jgi:chorismate synthase